MKRRSIVFIVGTGLLGLAILASWLFSGPQNRIVIVGVLSHEDAVLVQRIAWQQVLTDIADPSSGGTLKRLPGAFKYWKRHPFERIEVKAPDTVHVMFARRAYGEVLAYEYDYNVLGCRMVRTTNGWKVAAMLTAL